MGNIPKKNVVAWVILVLVFIVWFFSWREYMKYEIRSAFTEWFKEAFWGWEKNSNNEPIIEKEEPKPIQNIKKWESFIFSRWEWEDISIKVNEVKEYWTKYKQSEDSWTEIDGNNLVAIRLESENTWKKQTAKSLSEYNIKLITSDGMEFWPKSVEQITANRPDWFWGCISCSSNPWEKNVQDIIFDIDTEKVKWAKIILDEDDWVAFELK